MRNMQTPIHTHCVWCQKKLKHRNNCWYQKYCTGGKCATAARRDEITRGKMLARTTPR